MRIDRHTCLFYFASNMAEWHFSCAKPMNQAWIAETGNLSSQETAALSTFAALAREFSFGDRWMGRFFVLAPTGEQALEQTRDLMGDEKAHLLAGTLSALTPRFDAIWQGDLPRLQDFGDRLETELRSEKVGQAMSLVETYFRAACPPVTVHLLLSRGGWAIGGANEGPGHVTLAAMERPGIAVPVEVALHEVVHLMEEAKFRPMYRAFSERRGFSDRDGTNDSTPCHLIGEALAGALLPGGCLSKVLGYEVYDFEERAEEQAKMRSAPAAALSRLTGSYVPLVESYLASGRAADERLLEKAYDIFLQWSLTKKGRAL